HQHLTTDEVDYTIDMVRAFYGTGRRTAGGTPSATPAAGTPRLEFDRLVQEDMENLNVTLRRFQAARGHDFLASWVACYEPTSRRLAWVGLARDARLERLAIVVGPGTAARLNWERLAEAGPFSRHTSGEQTELEFALAATAGTAVAHGDTEIHPSYRKGL